MSLSPNRKLTVFVAKDKIQAFKRTSEFWKTGPLGTGSGVLLGCLLLAGSLPGWVHLNERSSWVHLNESNQPHTQRHRDVKDEQTVGLVDE